MATHSMQRALARMDAEATGNGHEATSPVLALSRVHLAMRDTIADLLDQSLKVREAPAALRTFARTTKHMLPAMTEATGNVPEEEIRQILVYIRDRLDGILTGPEGASADDEPAHP